MKIEVELKRFTPVLDILVAEYGLITAAVYGIVWRYSQMDNKVCEASLEKIGSRVGLSGKTAERHIKLLCEGGYLVDKTPDIRNKPHQYQMTGKAELTGSIAPRSDRESDLGQTESPTRSDRESDLGQTESPLKIHSKIHSKKVNKAYSAEADGGHNKNSPISLLTEKEIKNLKLPLAAWQQHLADEQADRNRAGVIKFLESKIATGPLLPDTKDARMLFEKLAEEAQAKGRRPPQKFPTLACKQKFDQAAARLNGTLERAIDKALVSGITAIPNIVNYISSPRWAEDKNNGQSRTGSASREQQSATKNTGNYAPPAGSGQTPEMRARLEAAFAPKP